MVTFPAIGFSAVWFLPSFTAQFWTLTFQTNWLSTNCPTVAAANQVIDADAWSVNVSCNGVHVLQVTSVHVLWASRYTISPHSVDGCDLSIGDSVSLLESAKHGINTLCSHVHQFAFDIVFAPLKLHLADVPNMLVSHQLWRLYGQHLMRCIDATHFCTWCMFHGVCLSVCLNIDCSMAHR